MNYECTLNFKDTFSDGYKEEVPSYFQSSAPPTAIITGTPISKLTTESSLECTEQCRQMGYDCWVAETTKNSDDTLTCSLYDRWNKTSIISTSVKYEGKNILCHFKMYFSNIFQF